MGISKNSRQGSFAVTEEGKSWDPRAVLEIVNPDLHGVSCVGYAPSQRRRCRNPIAQHNGASVTGMLERMASKSPTSTFVSSALPQVARLSLCQRFHQNQVDSVVQQWMSKIRSIKPFKRQPSFPAPELSEAHSNLLKDPTAAKMMAYFEEILKKSSGSSSASTTAYGEERGYQERDGNFNRDRTQFETLLERLERMERTTKKYEKKMRDEARRRHDQRERDEREKAEREEAEREEAEREEAEREEAEREEAEREEAEREEAEREEAEREKAEREKERREQAKQEREAQNERIRQRAQERREMKDREAREQARREKNEWAQAWKTYEIRWAAFKVNESPRNAIPWPVKSGCYVDVNDISVEDFFRNACPVADSPSAMYDTMRKECLKWHPDKISKLFGGSEPSEAERRAVGMAFRPVFALVGEARKKRQHSTV